MFLSSEIIEALTTKKPEKANNYNRTIIDYVRKNCEAFAHLENYNTGKTDLDSESYAAKVEIVSSGNEPKIYAYVLDNNKNVLFSCRRLGTSCEDYAIVASVAGLYLETFNQYMTINDFN